MRRWWGYPCCTRRTCLPQPYMSPPSETLDRLCSYKWCLHSGKEAKVNCMVIGLTWQWIEPTIYRTSGEHANHYTGGAVQSAINRIVWTMNYWNVLRPLHSTGIQGYTNNNKSLQCMMLQINNNYTPRTINL